MPCWKPDDSLICLYYVYSLLKDGALTMNFLCIPPRFRIPFGSNFALHKGR